MAEIYGFTIQVDGNAITQIKQINGGLDALNNKSKNATQSATSGFSQMKSMMGGMLGAMGVVGLIDGIVGAGKGILKLGSDMEQTKVSFDVMLGSAEKANTMVKELQRFANVTPFTSTEVFEGAKMLLNYGVAQQKVLPYMKMIGDASQGNSEKMKSMTYAFAQITATGRLMGQDLMQLVNAGFNPLQEISKKTGRSMGDLKKDMEEGKISADMVTDAFVSVTSEGGRFFGMMEKQSQTVAGLWSTFMDKIQLKAIGVFDALKPNILGALNSLNNFVDGIVNFYNWMNSGTTNANLFIAAIGVIGVGFAIVKIEAGLAALSTALLGTTMAATTLGMIAATFATQGFVAGMTAIWVAIGPLGWVVIAIGLITAAVIYCWKSFDKFRYAMIGIGQALLVALEPLLLVMKGIANMILGIISLDASRIAKGFDQLGQATDKLMTIGTDMGNAFNKGWDGAMAHDKLSALRKSIEESRAKSAEFRAKTAALRAKASGGNLGKSSNKTASLSGASGGLGEAKIINIKIDTMQKIDIEKGDSKDIVKNAPMSVELLARMINNITYSQSGTF